MFSSNLNVLQAWNSWSGVLPILEYCHLNLFCKVGQSLSIGVSDLYHSLASPVKVTLKHLYLFSFWEIMHFHPIFCTKKMRFCILFWLTWKFWFLTYPILIENLRNRYDTSRSQLCWDWLWYWLCRHRSWDLTCMDLILILISLSIWVFWIRGIWSFHL